MKQTLILYSSTDGQTLKISKRIAEILDDNHHQTELISIDRFNKSLSTYDTVIIGARVRHGKHLPQVGQFINKNKSSLKQMRTAFFSVNLTARNPQKNTVETNPYVQKFFKKVRWEADLAAVFAGKLDYRLYSFFDKLIIKLIMRISGGPTQSEQAIEFTNWEKVTEFANQLC